VILLSNWYLLVSLILEIFKFVMKFGRSKLKLLQQLSSDCSENFDVNFGQKSKRYEKEVERSGLPF